MIEDSGFGIQSIVVKDNSIRELPATSVLNMIPSIHPVFSSDGPDNVIREMTSFNDVLTEYGPDFSDLLAYGQQNLNVEKVFEGGGTAYLCRLLPEDAKTSHLVFGVGVKKGKEKRKIMVRDAYGNPSTDASGNTVFLKKKRMETVPNPDTSVGGTIQQEVEYEPEIPVLEFFPYIDYLPDTDTNTVGIDNIKAKLKTIHNKDIDGESTKFFPLFFMNYYANGKCGNKYGLRLINDFKRDEKTGDGRRYELFLTKLTEYGLETLAIGNDLSFSFNPKAKISKNANVSEGLHNVYQNYEGTVKKQIQIETFVNNYDLFKAETLSLYREIDEEYLKIEIEDFSRRNAKSFDDMDFIFGKMKDGHNYDNIFIHKTVETKTFITGVFMSKGSDGEFETHVSDPDAMNAAKNKLLKKFFEGRIDTKTITNVLKCDGGIIFDGNYDMDIKIAMYRLLKNRRDLCIVFDCGLTDSLKEAVGVANTIRSQCSFSDGGENCCIVPHCGMTADRNVNVRVTGTYEFAYGFMRLYKLNPFSVYAGKQGDFGCVRRMIFDWVVEETIPKGLEIKTAKQAQLYWATDLGKALSSFASGNVTGRNIYFYSNDNMYIERISKLSEFRNGVLVNDIRRVLKLVLCKYTFDTAGAASAMEKASSELTKIFNSRYPSNIEIKINLYQTTRDKLLNQATCEVSVFFPDIFETWNCIIIADRQEVTLEAA